MLSLDGTVSLNNIPMFNPYPLEEPIASECDVLAIAVFQYFAGPKQKDGKTTSLLWVQLDSKLPSRNLSSVQLCRCE